MESLLILVLMIFMLVICFGYYLNSKAQKAEIGSLKYALLKEKKNFREKQEEVDIFVKKLVIKENYISRLEKELAEVPTAQRLLIQKRIYESKNA